MPGPVSSAKKYSDFGSKDGLAKALIDGKGWSLNPRSLGTRIGQLDRGNVTWWLKNLDKAESLAQLLDIPLEDLGVHGRAGKGLFHFTEFPEFPPLDLKREESWALAQEQLDPKQAHPEFGDSLDDWFGNSLIGSWRSPHTMDWLYIPDDLHRQFLSRRLSVAGRHEVVFVETLAEAASRLMNPKPLIVSVSHDGGGNDLAALAGRPQDAGILVISPFMFPVREETSSAESFGWEQRYSSGLEGRKFDLTATRSFRGAVRRWTLNKLPDWRERLLVWVEERLYREHPDTYFSAQGIGEWLNRFDPLAEWFNTTSDVMHLCRLGHLASEKKFPAPDDFLAGDRLVESLFERHPSSRLLRIKQLAGARWVKSDLPWLGALPLEGWLSLSSAGSEAVSRAELEVIASGRTAKERAETVDKVAILLEAGNPEALVSSGLLKESRRGHFDFQHRTLAGLLVRDRLMRQIAQESLASWATHCFDSGRRPLVDAALDVVPFEFLVEAASKLEAEQPGSVALIGVSESLFKAIGMRIAKGELIPAALYVVARSVVEHLNLADDFELPSPWSRSIDSENGELEWISACWAWSLLSEARQEIPSNWLFPGWSCSLPKPPLWLNELWPDKKCEQVSLSWMRFLEIVDQWVKDLDEPAIQAPRVALFGFLRKAGQGLWKAEACWWEPIIGKPWAENILAKRLKEDGPMAAARLWPSFLEFERNYSADGRWNAQLSRVRYWLLVQMKPAEALTGLGEDDRRYLASVPETLPPEMRGPLLQSLGTNLTVWPEVDVFPNDFFARFGRQIASVLPDYLDYENYLVSLAAAQCLWSWDPNCAKRLLREKKGIGLVGRKQLVDSCPAAYLAIAIEALWGEPGLFDEVERSHWVREHLPTAGVEAASLLALLKIE